MYSRAKEGKPADGFEVFRIVVKGDSEEFPPPHEYGKSAFLVKSADEAEKMFTRLHQDTVCPTTTADVHSNSTRKVGIGSTSLRS
jgi:hypothetical protein